MVAVLGLGLALPSVTEAAPPPAVSAPSGAAARGRALTPDEAKSLEARQQKSKDLEKYEGGQVVIAISTVGVVIIALIILLILL